MRRAILLMFMLLAIAILAYSRTPAELGGTSGTALLKGLTNSSGNFSMANKTMANNTTANLSSSKIIVSLGGANGTELLDNLTNNPANLSWGSKPRAPPSPPSYKEALMAQVIHDNRG